MNQLSLDGIRMYASQVGKFFTVHNRMIYFILFICVLIGAILGLNLALYQPSDEDYRAKKMSETQSARFDTDTITKIKNLNAQQQTITDAPPAGQRTNPFGE